MSALIRTALYPSLNRPNLFMGGDRELMLFNFLVWLTYILLSSNLYIMAFSVFMMVSIIYLLRLMAERDPLMRHMYVRHRTYNAFYAAKASVYRDQ